MRIIAGEHRGRRIAAPPGRGTRPMLDRVREALFSIVQAELAEARVLDLFAGSGSLGLEALSRGAASARFVEADRRAAAVLSKNLAELGLDARAEVVVGDALAPASWCDSADLVLVDAPYPLLRERATRTRVFEALEAIGQGVLAPGGVAVLHAPRREVRAGEFGDGWDASNRDYGTSTLWILERGEQS